MTSSRRLALLVPAVAVSLAAAGLVAVAPPAAAATTTWVSGVGDDANPCSRTAPCKTFAGAITQTDEGGVINVLDPGGFGAVTITKSITIDGSEAEAGITANLVNAIVVNADPTDTVVLRGLDITGGYTAKPDGTCSPNAVNGIRVLRAGSVQVQDSRISGMAGDAISVAATAGSPRVTLDGVDMRNGCGDGIDVTPDAGLTASVEALDTTISAFGTGVRAAEGGSVRLLGSTVFGNGAAVATTGNGTVDTADPATHLVANEPLVVPSAPSVMAALRTWVSGVGDDANPCSRTAPCKTFAGAISKTAAGGEINVLDPGGYGPVTITKSITIDATGTVGRVLVGGGASGIIVNTSATQDVVLRGLDIVGSYDGTAPCVYGSTSGIRILGARSVHVENTSVWGFETAGIDLSPTTTSTRVVVNRSAISNVCGSALRVTPAAAQSVTALVRGSSILGSGTGLQVGAGGRGWLLDTVLSGVTTPTAVAGGGSVEALSDAPTPQPEPAPTVTVTVPAEPPVTIRSAQSPVACKALPKKLRASSTVVLLNHTCVTTGGQQVRVSASGKAKLARKAQGRIVVTTRAKGSVTLTMSAPETAAFLPFSVARTYRLR